MEFHIGFAPLLISLRIFATPTSFFWKSECFVPKSSFSPHGLSAYGIFLPFGNCILGSLFVCAYDLHVVYILAIDGKVFRLSCPYIRDVLVFPISGVSRLIVLDWGGVVLVCISLAGLLLAISITGFSSYFILVAFCLAKAAALMSRL